MGLRWKADLTLENLEDFCMEFIKPAYLMAYKATLNESQASGITVETLSRVFALREEYKEEAEPITPEKAIADAIEPQLSKTQFANFHNQSISADATALPAPETLISLVDKVVDRARSEMPRYAPVYSGTTAALVIIAVVAVITAAIALICIDPVKRLRGEPVSQSDAVIFADPATRLDPGYMLDLSSVVTDAASDGSSFNCGALPVLVSLGGPDAVRTRCVSATDVSGSDVPIYQFALDKYLYFADRERVYNVSALSSDGSEVMSYCSVFGFPSASDVLPISGAAAVTHDSVTEIPLFPAGSVSSAEIASAVSASDVQLLVREPALGTVAFIQGGAALSYAAGSTTGLDSIGFTYRADDGRLYDFTLPVLVSNSAPAVTSGSLSVSAAHTPTKPGSYAGKLTASDADGDSITYKLADTFNCSVLLTSSGSYFVSVDKEYSGSAASFSFTVSDGLITTEPITVQISLENQMLNKTEFSQNIVYYGEEGYFFEIPLPEKDLDGDPVRWKLISPLPGELSSNGSEMKISDDGKSLLYHPAEAMNKDTSELVSLVCSDGWLDSPTISFVINISENKPPVGDEGNSVSVPMDQASVTCTLKTVDDYELDKCVIDSVYRSFGGTVAPNEGWENMTFTFSPDGTEDNCYVILTVRDVLTGSTSNIRYDIIRA